MHTSLLTLAVAVTIAAPVPKAKDAEIYFPTTVGAKRVLVMTTRGHSTESIETVTKVEEKSGIYAVTVETEDPQILKPPEFVNHPIKYEVSGKGVYLAAGGGRRLPVPQQLFNPSAKSGETWLRTEPKAVYTMQEEELVEVPAGKFKARKVEAKFDMGSELNLSFTSWYAPAVGVVKQVIVLGKNEFVTELKSFSIEKAEPKKDK